jgi:hypothetical protein
MYYRDLLCEAAKSGNAGDAHSARLPAGGGKWLLIRTAFYPTMVGIPSLKTGAFSPIFCKRLYNSGFVFFTVGSLIAGLANPLLYRR